MRISVIGSGYVGLVSGACLAEVGHDVVCVDVDRDKVERINRADPPMFERGLASLLRSHVPEKLRATTDLESAVCDTEVTLITVGTPFHDGAIDLAYVEQAALQVGRALTRKDRYHTVVVKSTVVPGTTDGVVLPLLERASGKTAGIDFGVGMNPEFLREGEAVADFMSPDRIVYGGIDGRTLSSLDRLYAPFGDVDAVRTTNRTAEMIKYTSNSLLATMISFSNEIANLCAALGGIDVLDVMEGVNLDKRISPLLDDGTRIVPGFTTYLAAGCGFGGSCFPKDLRALVAHGAEAGVPMRLLSSVLEVNEEQPAQLLTLLAENFEDLRGLDICVLGLSFKPGTSDTRHSPALPLVAALGAAGARVVAYDPAVNEEAGLHLDGLDVAIRPTMAEAIRDVDAILLVTAWPEFRALPELLEGVSPQPLVLDGRRVLPPEAFERYEGIGRSGFRDGVVPRRAPGRRKPIPRQDPHLRPSRRPTGTEAR